MLGAACPTPSLTPSGRKTTAKHPSKPRETGLLPVEAGYLIWPFMGYNEEDANFRVLVPPFLASDAFYLAKQHRLSDFAATST